ncbi:MAG: extracellular solute-binding protein [Lachnospiraceae bacterium]|nr:extracellular solute-binding protein [Lachnospiraceae bacterium]
MKKYLLTSMLLFILSVFLTGCTEYTELSSRDPVTLIMWHNYGGEMQKTMDLLIDEFNATVGKEKGILVTVSAISSSSDLNNALDMIANEIPGAPQIPDISTGYPKTAIQLQQKDMLADLDQYFTDEELSEYVDAFIEEGRLPDGGLYVFPLAKSTEVLYINQTLFDEFAEQTGASADLLSTFEGIAELSRMYYEWSGGKQFFTSDSWFNLAEVGMKQLGTSLFDEENNLSLENDSYMRILETLYTPATEGGFAIYDGYSSDLSKTGDIICSTGSSAGILFYGDTITFPDSSTREVEYNILPYPVFENAQKWALQRGGGLIVFKSEDRRELAAAEFLKWLTAPEQNMSFISQTGYLPVTKQAFESDLLTHLENMEDGQIKKMLTSVLSMYEEYRFFAAPNFMEFDEISEGYETNFKNQMTEGQKAYQENSPVSVLDVQRELMK